MRKPVMGIVGWGAAVADQGREPAEAAAERLGGAAIEAGFRIVTGGLGGVMAAAGRGARASSAHRDGDVIGIVPGHDAREANPYADIVIPSGLGVARNVLVVATSDVVVAVGGGAGTLSELAIAWQLGRPVVALRTVAGWGARLAGQALDERRGDVIIEAVDAADAIAQALAALGDGAGRR